MKLVYATDLHGDAAAYAALADLAVRERARALLLGGDLFAYSRQAAPQLAFADGPFRRFLLRLRSAGLPVIAIHGNDDRTAVVTRLQALAAEGLLRLANLQPQHLIGVDDPAAPWIAAAPDLLDRLPSIEGELAAAPPIARPWVLLAHSPPWGVLDRAATAQHAGSRAIRAWIVARRPILALHGHIHEAPGLLGRWAERLGATICVNPGPACGTTVRATVAETAALPRGLWHTERGTSGR